MIAAIGAEQDNALPEPSGAELAVGAAPIASVERQAPDPVASAPKGPELVERIESPERRVNPKSEILNPQSDIPLLTLEEKRRILAQIARVNPTDCFDDTGAFDMARAKRILPPGAVRHIAIQETTRMDAEGQPITERSIQLRLVDPVSALRLDDQLERRRERTAASPPPASDSTPPHPASPEYAHNLLRKNTIALDEALHTLALLKKALAEKKDRHLQLSKELDEKDRQLLQTLSLSNGSETLTLSSGSQTLSKVEGELTHSSPVSDTRHPSPQTHGHEPEFVGQALRLPEFPNTPEPGTAFDAENLSPSSMALQSRDQGTQCDTGCQPVQKMLQTSPGFQSLDIKNSTGPAASAERPRNRAMEPANEHLQDPPTKSLPAKTKKFAGYRPFGSSARPPPRAWRS